MKASYAISASYYAGASGGVTFPEGKTWADVEEHYIKWDNLYVKFKGENDYVEFDISSDFSDSIDTKRPISYEIFGFDEDGEVDYSEVLVDTGE